MWHTSMEAVQRCISACPRRETIIVLSVREPYTYWLSAYRYAVQGVRSPWHPPTWAKANLTAFVAWAAPHEALPIELHHSSAISFVKQSQTALVQRACGNPCKYDLLLRAEQLAEDWRALLQALQLPPIELPRININSLREADVTRIATSEPQRFSPFRLSHPHVTATATKDPFTFTAQSVAQIDNMESWIFSTFGYTHRATSQRAKNT